MGVKKKSLYIVYISEETSNIGNAFLPPPADGQYGQLGAAIGTCHRLVVSAGWSCLLVGLVCWQAQLHAGIAANGLADW